MNSWNELQAGMFIHFHCRTTQPQKQKFALVVAVETQCAIALLINSEPSEFILAKPDLLNQQLQLFRSGVAISEARQLARLLVGPRLQ